MNRKSRGLHTPGAPISAARKALLFGHGTGKPVRRQPTENTSRLPGGVSAASKGGRRLPRTKLTVMTV